MTYKLIPKMIFSTLIIAIILVIVIVLLSVVYIAKTEARDKAKLEIVPSQFAVVQQCGKSIGEGGVPNQQSAIVCPGQRTDVVWGAPARHLGGRRVYFSGELGMAERPSINIGISITSFRDNRLMSHVGAVYLSAGGLIEASTFVPPEADRLSISIHSYDGPATFTVSSPQVRATVDSFTEGDMCRKCKRFLDDVLNRIEKDFLYLDRVDVAEIKRGAYLSATGASSTHDLAATTKEIVRLLNEPHSRFVTTAEIAVMTREMGLLLKRNDSRKSQDSSANSQVTGQPLVSPVKAKMVQDDIGYIRVLGAPGVDREYRTNYAKHIRSALNDLHMKGARRWIVDLRAHGGGATPPLIAGFRPLLGEGPVGYFFYARQARSPWLFGDSAESRFTGEIYLEKKDKVFDGKCAPVAVLTSNQTASAAEALVVSFKGRDNTRFFGQATAGYTTSVKDHPPLADGSILGITNGHLADKLGQVYSARISPDVVIEATSSTLTDDDDLVTKHAIAWLTGNQRSTASIEGACKP